MLNLGVRYAYYSPFHEVNNRLGNFDPVALTLTPTSPTRAPLDRSSTNCCPMVYWSARYAGRLAQPQPSSSGNASCLQQTRIRTECVTCRYLTDGLGPVGPDQWGPPV